MFEEKPIKTDFSNKYFMLLHANFFDSLQKISQNHQILCKYLLEDMSKNDEEKTKINHAKILTITESLKTIVEIDLRNYYFLYLKFIFCLSQPLTMYQLRTNFKNKLFPYYLFTLLLRKKEIVHLIIDFFEKKILILNKEKKLETINQEKIVSVSKKSNISIVLTLSEKISNDKQKEIEIFPEFFQQVDLIYNIINYFINYKVKDDESICDIDENGLSLIEDDTYLPKGIILKDNILKEHQNKLLSKDKRYAVLGTSLIIIFKDKSLKEIRNIIPLLPFATQLITDDKELEITFKYFYRDQSLSFFDEDTYIVWKNTIKDIFNKKNIERIEGITLYQIREKTLNNKILDLINDEIKDVQDKIKEKNEDLINLKKVITQDDKDNKDNQDNINMINEK